MYCILAPPLILLPGTLYSRITAHPDPCALLDSQIHHPPSQIPKYYHTQGRTPAITAQMSSWISLLSMPTFVEYPNIPLNPTSWTHVHWSDESCLSLISEVYPEFLSSYTNYQHVIQRVDSCRYFLLHAYGGVYADSDVSLHDKRIEELLPTGVGVVESPYRYNEKVQNSIMSSAKGHEFWSTVVFPIMKKRSKGGEVLGTTGPGMLSDALKEAEGDVEILPCELFQRLPYGQYDTTWLNILGREVLSRAVPMKGCGNFGGECEVTKHWGAASWTKSAGLT